MKKVLFALSLVVLSFLTGCFKTLEDDPEMLYRMIRKDPKKFFDVLNEVATEARRQSELDEEKKQQEKMEEEFKNPKKVVTEGRIAFGDANAPVTIVEYSDFFCHYCALANKTVNDLLKRYEGKVKVIYKHRPILTEKSTLAAQYYELVALQGAALVQEFHDQVFAHQDALKMTGEAELKRIAKALSVKAADGKAQTVDMAKLEKDFNDKEVMQKINEKIAADSKEGADNGFSGTPGFLINGVSLAGNYPMESFVSLIDRHLGVKK